MSACTLQEVQLPDGESTADIKCINANGVIATLNPNAGSSSMTSNARTTTMAAQSMVSPAAASGYKSPASGLRPPVKLTIYSNQLEGVECNKLPTGLPYKSSKPGVISDYNNPMIMGTQYGVHGSFSVVVNGVPSNLVSNYLVGVKKAGTTDILGYATAQAAPAQTKVYFDASSGINAAGCKTFYKVVVGYDANQDGVLDPSEIIYEFGDEHSAAETSPQDKIIVTESDDYQDANTYLAGKANTLSYLYTVAPELLRTFIDPTHTPNGATATTFTLYSNDPELKCPVGACWAQSGTAGMATANFYTFSNGSSVASAVENSKTFKNVLTTEMGKLKPAVQAYFANNPTVSQHTFDVIPFTWTIHFSDYDGQKSDVNLAFGTVSNLTGHMQVTVQKSWLGSLDLSSIYYDANFNDIYDFYIFANLKGDPFQLSQNAAVLQAGYGTLGQAGKVFESNVNFSNTKPASTFGWISFTF